MLGLSLELVLVMWVLVPGAGLAVLGSIATTNRAERRRPRSEQIGPAEYRTGAAGPAA